MRGNSEIYSQLLLLSLEKSLSMKFLFINNILKFFCDHRIFEMIELQFNYSSSRL